MRVEYLYEYIVLTHCMNFTAAAAKLRTSQPNLSKHIAELESELGVQLFQRGRQLKLTAAGRVFLKDAIQIHHQVKDSITRCQDVAQHKAEELIIQEPYLHDRLSQLLFKATMKFRQENPYVLTQYYTERGVRSLELLEAGKIDIAQTVACRSDEWIERMSRRHRFVFHAVLKEPLHVWMHDDHPLAARSSISLDDLRKAPINMTATRTFDPMRYAIIDLFQKTFGHRPDLRHPNAADTLNEFFMSIQEHEIVFLVTPVIAASPLLASQQNMVSRQIDDPRAIITSYLVTKADETKESVSNYINVITRIAREEANPDHSANPLDHDEKGPRTTEQESLPTSDLF